MSEPQFIVGIDLGTTHGVLAFARAGDPSEAAPEVQLFAAPQLVGPGEFKDQPLLPSFLLLPGPHDVAPGSLDLPWQAEPGYAVGEFARSRGADLPARLVVSAKSWLSYAGVDRTQPILPWDAPADTAKVSPVEASARYLEHLRQAWNYRMAADDPDARLERQEVYLTVPASFDAVARELTVQAARQAGLERFTLLEEPQAAFYAWLAAHPTTWRDLVHVGESILVCDVGGGTTDFSLIQVIEEEGNLALQRVAVGDHILLGGDNMDLTLAYAVRGKLAQSGTQLDNWQFRSLWHSCRQAKERLLSNPDLSTEPVVILGRGSSLIGGTIRTELTRAEIEAILVSGFFPVGELSEHPVRKPQVGMRELGLPYASDPAITRHLAQFLNRQVGQTGGDGAAVAFPSAVLFNGGVMKAASPRGQVLDALRRWSGNDAFRELDAVDMDLAVALGAAYYGFARQGRGIRIRAGAARAYYIGVESAMPAVPGVPTPIKALCVVPFGMEEGTDAEIVDKEFGLVVGEPAVFHFLASSIRKHDRAGEVVEDWAGEIQEVTTLETFLPASDAEGGGTLIPVWLQTRVKNRNDSRGGDVGGSGSRLGGVEVGEGVLEIWCIERDGDREWKLAFDVRYNPT